MDNAPERLVHLTEVVDGQPVGPLVIRVGGLCALVAFLDGLDSTSIGIVRLDSWRGVRRGRPGSVRRSLVRPGPGIAGRAHAGACGVTATPGWLYGRAGETSWSDPAATRPHPSKRCPRTRRCRGCLSAGSGRRLVPAPPADRSVRNQAANPTSLVGRAEGGLRAPGTRRSLGSYLSAWLAPAGRQAAGPHVQAGFPASAPCSDSSLSGMAVFASAAGSHLLPATTRARPCA